MENENSNISTEFVDINEESKYKNYIIVGILYVIVIILSILLIIGLKNQKDVVKEKIEEKSTAEDKIQNPTLEEDVNISEENKSSTDDQNTNSNNIFENVSSSVDEFNNRTNQELNEGSNLLGQIE